MLSIGNLNVASQLVLAPMAGITDLPFRIISRSFGCELAFTEMISTHSLIRNNRITLKMLSTSPDDRPVGVQILGCDPEIIKRALDILSGYAFDIIDFNAACPVNKVALKGEGAGLLRDPVKLKKLLKVIVETTKLPVTVKIRSGWDGTSVNAVKTALYAQDAGVQGVVIHGRTREQGYSGNVDYSVIRDVKESVGIPVIASGDALTPDLIRKLFDETGCNGVAVARGALGNPWIFRETIGYLKSGTIPCRPDTYEIVQTMKKHLALLEEFHGERTGVMLFRKLFTWYTRGMTAKQLKVRAFLAGTSDDMLQLIEEIQALPGLERCLKKPC